MHLVSLEAADGDALRAHVRFAPGETIHTENSYKYTVEVLRARWREAAGWRPVTLGPIRDDLFLGSCADFIQSAGCRRGGESRCGRF